jgi:hypothetical protein
LTPPGVTDALGQMMILNHSPHVQIFNGDRVKLLDEIERRLVVEVRALALNLLMLLRQKIDRFSPSLRSLLTSGDFALSGFQLPFGLTQEFGILNYLARRERGEVLNPDIGPNGVAGFGKESALILFDRKDCIPAISLPLDHAGLNRPFNWTGKTDTARADFGQMKFVAFEPKAALRIGEGIKARGRLESRIPWRFTALHPAKEAIEGFIQTAKSVLKDLTVYRAKVFADFLDLRKLDGLGVVVDRNAVDLIGVTPFLQRGVIQLAAYVECCATCRIKL